MPRKLTTEDYKKIGTEKGLDFIGELYDPAVLERLSSDFHYYVCGGIPPSSSDPTNWRCQITGKIIFKQIRAVQRRRYGSRYQKKFWDTLRKYNALANRLGIIFLYDPDNEFFPTTTKDSCRWLAKNGQEVQISYHHLGYAIVTSSTKKLLGLEADIVYNI